MSQRRHLSQVARGGAIGLIGAAVSAVAGFALVVIVTRVFSAHEAGQFFAASSLVLMVTQAATLGTDTGLGRFMLRYETLGRKADIPIVLRTAYVTTLGVAIVLAAVMIAFAEPITRAVGINGGEGATALRLLAAAIPFIVLSNVSLSGTRAFGRMRTTALIDSITRSVAQPALIIAVSMVSVHLVGLTLAWTLPYVLTSVLATHRFRVFLRRRAATDNAEPAPGVWAPPGHVRRSQASNVRREFWGFTWPRGLTALAQMGLQRLDIVLIAALRSPQEAAVYTAATRFVALGQLGSKAITQVLQPKFTELMAAHEQDTLGNVYRTAAAWSVVISWPIYLVVGAAPLAYLQLFGSPGGSDSHTTVVILLMVAAQLYNVATGPADVIVLMSGHSRASMATIFLALSIDIILCLVLIPRLGIVGAAVAWAVANFARGTGSALLAQRLVGVRSLGRPLLAATSASLVTVALPLAVAGRFIAIDLVHLLIALLVVGPLYLAALWVGRRPLRLRAWRDVLSG